MTTVGERTRSRRDRPADDLDDLDDHDALDAASPSPRRSAGRRPVRGARRLLLTVLAVVALIGAVATAYFTPLMSVRTISVEGTSAVDPQQVIDAAGIVRGTPLLQVDTRPAAGRVAAITRIKSVRVSRAYPSTIHIAVVERVPVALRMVSGVAHLVDVDDVDLGPAQGRSELPRVTSSSKSATRAALTVVAGLPPSLRTQVVEVGATSPADVRLRLTDDRTVVWGDDELGPQKARTLSYLLTRPGTEYNVSAPGFPAFR